MDNTSIGSVLGGPEGVELLEVHIMACTKRYIDTSEENAILLSRLCGRRSGAEMPRAAMEASSVDEAGRSGKVEMTPNTADDRLSNIAGVCGTSNASSADDRSEPTGHKMNGSPSTLAPPAALYHRNRCWAVEVGIQVRFPVVKRFSASNPPGSTIPI
jgi:hypothetical protein